MVLLIFLSMSISTGVVQESIQNTTKDSIQNTKDISCFHCHSAEVKQFETSRHFGKISCTDCHGGDISINGSLVSLNVMNKDSNFIGTPSKLNITKLCSQCHKDTVDLYKESIHYKKLISGRDSAASCIDCHNMHNVLSYTDSNSKTYPKNVPELCANCHENQTRMQAWYYGIQTDRFDTYKNSYHYKAIILGTEQKSLATCDDCHENHNTKNQTDPTSAIYPGNLAKTCEKEGCHSKQGAVIYGGTVHEGKSVYLLDTRIDLKSLVTYFYILMILFEISFTFGLIALGIYSQIEIKKRG